VIQKIVRHTSWRNRYYQQSRAYTGINFLLFIEPQVTNGELFW